MTKEVTEEERNLNKFRCQVCGKFHPFITVCPYIRSIKTEQIRDARNPNLRGRITTTEYYERKELLETAVESLEEAEAIAKDESDSLR